MNFQTTQIDGNTLIWEEDMGYHGYFFVTDTGILLDYYNNHRGIPRWVQEYVQRGGDSLNPENITVQQLETLERVLDGGLGWCDGCHRWTFNSKKCQHCGGDLQYDFPDMRHGVDY